MPGFDAPSNPGAVAVRGAGADADGTGMRSWIAIGLLLTLLGGLVLALLTLRPDLRDRLVERIEGPLAPEPVLIMVVGHRENVSSLRRTLGDHGVVHADNRSFALANGRIIAARIEDASDALNALDWTERPLEIIDPRVHGIGAASLAPGPASSGAVRGLDPKTNPADGGLSLAELAKQPTLTPDEALRALRMLR